MKYELTPITYDDMNEVMQLYHKMIGSEGCTWDEQYPNEEILHNDIALHNIYGIRNGDQTIIAVISYDVDEAVANLSCWNKSWKKVAYKKFHFTYKGEVKLFDHDWFAYEQQFVI